MGDIEAIKMYNYEHPDQQNFRNSFGLWIIIMYISYYGVDNRYTMQTRSMA